MNGKTRRFFALLLTVVLALTVMVSVASATAFRTTLNGSEEVPSVRTSARGEFAIKFNPAATAASFTLSANNIQDVIAAHVHCAPPGTNGPVGITLYMGDPITPNGMFAGGKLTSPDAGNSCGWETMADVLAAIQAGNAYVNVHTLEYPAGEIRGQI